MVHGVAVPSALRRDFVGAVNGFKSGECSIIIHYVHALFRLRKEEEISDHLSSFIIRHCFIYHGSSIRR